MWVRPIRYEERQVLPLVVNELELHFCVQQQQQQRQSRGKLCLAGLYSKGRSHTSKT
jgi:hypothetical protein